MDLITSLAQQGKYFLLFIVYLIEGPIFGFISAIVASTGAISIFIVAILLITGEIGADLVYYYLGRTSSEIRLSKTLQKYENKGLLNTIKQTLIEHPVRALIIVKTITFIAVPSLLLLGRYRAMRAGKFLFWTTIICLIKDFVILFLGYAIGISLENFLDGYDIYRVVGIILFLVILGYLVFKSQKERIEEYTIKKLEGIK